MQAWVLVEVLGWFIGYTLLILVLWVVITLISEYWLFDIIHDQFTNLSYLLWWDTITIFISIFVIIFLVFIGRWLLSFVSANSWQSANQ